MEKLCRHATNMIAVLVFLTVGIALGQTDTTAVVATWNLGAFDPISDPKASQIARAIADLDPEVIALTEVNPDDITEKLVAELKDLGAIYTAVILDQTAHQNIAILHKDGVLVQNKHLIPSSDDGRRRLRKALTVDVSVGKFDFILIAVHLKANRGTSARNTRTRQVKVLADFIESKTSGDEKDVLLIGDYNMIPGQDEVNFDSLDPNDFLRFLSSEELSDEISHIRNPTGPEGNLLDGFAISDDFTREYVEGSLRIYPIQRALGLSMSEYVDRVSDHLPLVARFRIASDDD